MAYIRKLPSGNFNAIVRLPNGQRKSITDPLRRVVKQRSDELEAAIRHGDIGHLRDRKLTLSAWAEKWFEARRVERNTAVKNASHWKNHIEPRWGDWPLAAIDRLDVQAWVNSMEKSGLGAWTVAACYNLLSKMLGDAVLSKKLHASPCVEIALPTIVPPAERWLTSHEYDRIQMALANRMLEVPHRGPETTLRPDPRAVMWQAFVALGCYSGLRCPGELAGLDVRHLDFERNLVRVQQVWTRHGMKDYPKTGAGSERWVPFPPDVADLLWRWVGERTSGPVFTGTRGARVTEIAIRRMWRAALLDAGVEYVDPYTMRHTAASWLAQAGVSSDEIADILGHSSTRMVSVYRHLRPGVHDRVRAAWASDAEILDPRPTHAGNEKSPSPVGLGL